MSRPGTLTPLDGRERVQLCARMEELGPDAPTLCGRWSTFDLAAHLVVRERNLLAAPGILVEFGPFPGLTASAMARQKRRGYGAVLERVRTGPPPGPFAVPALREVLNLGEYFIHHEDVRRANAMTEPRAGIDDVHERLWPVLRRLGKRLFRAVPADHGVTLVTPGHDPLVLRDRPGSSVRVLGEPGELLLYGYGRRDAAHVVLEGDDAAVAAVGRAPMGI
jgi:uncharacterized protein (TIGR03085 family)